MSDLDEMIRKATEALVSEKEEEAYKELRERGIIGDVALFVHPIHKGIIEQALFLGGIKRIPIIYTDVIEKDKIIATTDMELVRETRRMVGMGIEEEASE